MPRNSQLSQLIPNKTYSVQGTIKYKHEADKFITAIIQQGDTQVKIKIPQNQQGQINVQEGMNYKFTNCFYNKRGWLNVRKPKQTIEAIQIAESPLKSIKQISQELQKDQYVSTFLKILSIQPSKNLIKNGKNLTITTMKGYASKMLVDVTIWNQDVDMDLVGKWVELNGYRLKFLTQDHFILVSNVYSKIIPCKEQQWEIKDDYNPAQLQNYKNLSNIYKHRILNQIQTISDPKLKYFSIVKAKVKGITSHDYIGCSDCKKQLDESSPLYPTCQFCFKQIPKKFSYGKVILEDESNFIQCIVFDQKIQEMFKFAKQNTQIECKIKSFCRLNEDEIVVSHILTHIQTIFF